MQIRLRLHHVSWPDRRRLCVQVRPGTEMHTEAGGPASCCALVQAGVPETEQRRTGTGRLALSLHGPVQARRGEGSLPAESARFPPSSSRSPMAPSRLPWASVAHLRLLWKPHGSHGSSAAPGGSLQFPPAPTEELGSLLHRAMGR